MVSSSKMSLGSVARARATSRRRWSIVVRSRASVLAFYQSVYQAGARLAGWDIQRLASPGGITDPRLRPRQG